MCERRVDLLVCSLPLHRHSYIGYILAFASSIHNKQHYVRCRRSVTPNACCVIARRRQTQLLDPPQSRSIVPVVCFIALGDTWRRLRLKSPPLLSLTPLLLPCPRQTPCAQHPPLLRCSTRPAPRTLTEARTSKRSSRLGCRAARAEGSSLGKRHPKTRWWQGRGQQTGCWRQGRGPQTRRLPMRYGKGSRKTLILPLFKIVALANSLRGPAQQRKASSLLRR